ncbi:nectin-3-like protein isoform X1 [Limanda limanda]|uniref:nectin-3-like protein isoform X1 n=1 Tax=Limanda limanda TaxID=27771 RepID=UPI0029C8CFB7|nr:nectin-3-like protein isoform X1 [Limanda limanda]
MWLMLLFFLNVNTQTNALQVIGGNRTLVQGRTVTFNCKLVDATETLTQITWQRTTRVKKNNDFLTVRETNGPVYVNGRDDRIKFIGSFNGHNGSIQISNVSLLDEGIYTCIFTLFPSGIHNTHIHLDVLVPPVIRVENNRPTLADKEVCIATCTAADSKPPANVSWLTGSLAENLMATANSTPQDHGKTTTVSYLFGVPTMGINQQVVHCVVTSPALSKEAEIPFTIQVYFAPMEVTIVENPEEDSFQCETDSNPKPEFNWTRVDQAWPQSGVRVEDGTLQFLKRSSHLNGLYQCTAFNQYGRSSVYIFRSVIPEPCTVCWILFSLLIVLIVAAAVWYLWKSDKLFFLRSRRVPVTRRETEVINPDEAPSPEDL